MQYYIYLFTAYIAECVWVVSGYNESITINLNKITDMWNVGVA